MKGHVVTDPRKVISDLEGRVGQELGVSEWVLITQEMINQFSVATRDPDPMHIDPEWCAKHSPFKTTIAFGFLTMSLLISMFHDVLEIRSSAGESEEDLTYGLNYGFDKLRLMAPVPVGSRIRGKFTLGETKRRNPGELLQAVDVIVEIEGQEKPALAGRWLSIAITSEGHDRIANISAESKQRSINEPA